MAPELFHRTTPPGFEADYGDYDAIRPHMAALTTDGIVGDACQTYEWATSQPGIDKARIACIGFCMGGRAPYLANAALDLRAAISFYGGGPLLTASRRCRCAHGGREVHEQVIFSDADHGFFCDRRPSYNASAAQQAWALCLAFLQTNGVM